MRRKLLLAVVAALMLTLTAGAAAPVAGASAGEAQVAKKRGSKRAARCKAKRGKARRGKARKAVAAKRKASRRKASRCKARRKPQRRSAAPKRGAGSVDGFYEDGAHDVTLRVSGSTAEATFPLPGDCFSGILVNVDGDAQASASTLRANGTTIGGGGYLTIPWSMSVKLPSLSYVLDVRQSTSFPDQAPCRGGGKITGTLVKR